MKELRILYKVIVGIVGTAWLAVQPAAGQVNGNRYNTNYSDRTIQHKATGTTKNKWFQTREATGMSASAKAMDTFNDEVWSFNVYGHDVQAAHTFTDTLYVHKGRSVTLNLPTVSNGGDQNSAQKYQRWYNLVTDGLFRTGNTGDRQVQDLLTPSSGTVYRLANGYVGGHGLLGSSSIMYNANFYYPTEGEFREWNVENGEYGNAMYVVACDLSGYMDFTNTFKEGQSGGLSFMPNNRNDPIEPTLSLRAVYVIVGVDDVDAEDDFRDNPDFWTKGHGRLLSTEYQGGNATGKKFLEEYDITFPCDHISNRTDEVVTLSKSAMGYGLPDVSGSSNVNLSVQLVDNGAGLSLQTASLSGKNRVIKFRKQGVGGNTPWSVTDGSKATIVVTKTVDRTTYNIAKFNLTFRKDTRLLTQHQLERIDTRDGNVATQTWYMPTRTPRYLRENYQLLTSRTFDYDPAVAADYGSDMYYPYPLEWGYSSYAFFDGSLKTDFDGSTSNNSNYGNQPFVEWGSYAITNSYVGYNDMVNLKGTSPDPYLGGRGEEGDKSEYFLYVDAADLPGSIVTLPFAVNLCRGSELFVSAWVKGAGAAGTEDAAMLFTINGIDADGNKTPLYKQSTGQIRTTTYMTRASSTEYTGNNGYGEGTNDWYQIFFSFINDDEKNAGFVSYELQVDNNCASTNGGDFYLDDIEVFIAQPTAEVEQLEYTCVNDRTPLNITLDWNQLCERLGIDESLTHGNAAEGIDFCFIDTVKYARLLADAGTRQDSIEALKDAIVNVGAADDESEGYDEPIVSLFFYLDWEKNDPYPKHQVGADGRKIYNIAYKHKKDDGNFYFYATGTEAESNRKLSVDFYSDLSPNRPYLMLIIDRDLQKGQATAEDFYDMMDDPCGIKTLFYVTSQTMVKVNGEVLDPQTDFCEGQVFSFGAQIRVPTGFNDEGEQQFVVLNEGVYFDWFFGTEDEFTTGNMEYGNVSLYVALAHFRGHYPDAETLEGVVPQPADGDAGTPELTQEDIDLIRHYLTVEGDAGGLNHPLVLHRENLDIRILETGLQLVVYPIHKDFPPAEAGITDEQWTRVCTSYVPLELHANGKAPTLYAGFNHIMDYPSGYNPALRIGLDQIKRVKCDGGQNTNKLRIDLRDASYVSDGVDRLGLIDYNPGTDEVDYTQVYLVDTDDPQYERYFANTTPENFNEFMLPIGKLSALVGEEYEVGGGFDNHADLGFFLDEQQLADGTTFTFAPREGFYYTFIVHFEEKTGGGEATTSCWGSFPVTMKVVPEYLVWDDKQAGENGVVTGNWHEDGNWRRASKGDLHKAQTDNIYEEYADGDGRAFTPMLFSKIVMPRGSKVELYAAGLSHSGSGQEWVTQRPPHIGAPTDNIQYDLMAYDHKADGSQLETEPFRVSMTDEIHFEPEAEMLHAEYLYYNKAYTDVELEGGQWYTLASPLQEVVAGDFYTKRSGREDAGYFTGISFDGSENDRFSPSFYQRAWKDDAETVPLQTRQDGVKNVAVAGNWSALYNDVDERYPSGWGFSLKVQDLADEAGGKVLVRLPKEDDSYRYYSQDGAAFGHMTGIRRNESAVGKLKSDSLFVRKLTPDYGWGSTVDGALEVGLGTSAAGGYYLVGNPFMSHLDVAEFLTVNSDVLERKYWYVENGVQDAAVAAAQGDQGWISVAEGASGAALVPPMRSFFVKKAENAAGRTVKFTAGMQAFVPEAAGGNVNANLLRLTATTEDGRESRAVVVYADGASEDYVSSEDAELFLDSNLGDVPSVYTVGGTQALSVNVTPATKRIPLGVHGAEDEAVALRFEGTDVCNGAELYDALTQVRTALYDGMEITVRTNEDGRYYIVPAGTGLEKEKEAGDEFAVYSVRSGEVVVASSVGSLASVKVYTVGGVLMAEETCAEGTTMCRLAVKGNENYVVQVTNVYGKKADVKLHVK